MKDEERVYFLCEHVQGCDLFDAIRAMGLLSDVDSKFYAAVVLLILEYLHDRNIVYRDLKPENVMIDAQGYPKLIYFGTAKVIDTRTYTIVGTPHYMAPEIIVGKGYDGKVDYWALGCILFEFMCGGVPFGEEEEDPYAVYELILTAPIRYPPYVKKPFHARGIIE
jgi:cGMP-dependent protein kinase